MASRSFRLFVVQEMGKFPHFVIYAILEWILIALIFTNGIIAFISEEFAKFFELKAPCLLCSRIDHIIKNNKNSNFYYNDSICESHKKEISSLAYCHIHQKLSNIKTMCEGCLLSFATERERDIDTYKPTIDSLMEDDLKTRLRSTVEKGLIQRCTCCGEPLKKRKSSKNLSRISSMTHCPAPSPRAPAMTWKNEESRGSDLSHIRYTELKFRPDNESSSLGEDEYGSNLARREENKAASIPLLPEPEDTVEEPFKTPSFNKGNKFFGISLTDSATSSPRWTRLTKKLQLDKSEQNSEPNEPESDSILTHLKKQVKLDRRTLIEMYMELDEERSASAVAANNAMAMITKLQAEKTAVQMESLQYQRMMEEQAEYDEEAIQVMRDLLAKRENEIKELEGELDTYRERYGPVSRVGSEICDEDEENYRELRSQTVSTISERSESGNSGKGKGEKTLEDFIDFESERSYLLGFLTDLERKLIRPSNYKLEDEDAGVDTKDMLTKGVTFMRERLREIEADGGFLKHAAMTLQKGGEGTKLLTEIALRLRKLRQLAKDIDA